MECGIPYCRKLLQADILPQKLSRRKAIVIFPGSSGVAWISTGTRKSASRNASAMARSSPKFGSVTTMPSIRSRFRLKRSAQRLDSSRVSTAPYLLSSGVSATTSIPAAIKTRSISSRPLLARWSGKKPRFPTIRPIVIFLVAIPCLYKPISLDLPPGDEFHTVDQSDYQKHGAPPHIGVQVEQDYIRIHWRIHHLVDSCGTNQCAVHGQ